MHNAHEKSKKVLYIVIIKQTIEFFVKPHSPLFVNLGDIQFRPVAHTKHSWLASMFNWPWAKTVFVTQIYNDIHIDFYCILLTVKYYSFFFSLKTHSKKLKNITLFAVQIQTDTTERCVFFWAIILYLYFKNKTQTVQQEKHKIQYIGTNIL